MVRYGREWYGARCSHRLDNRYAHACPDMRRHKGLVWELWGNALGGAWVSLEKPGYVWDTSWGDLEQDRDMIKTWLAWESGGKCSGQCLGRGGGRREGSQSISWSHCIDDMRNDEVDGEYDDDNEIGTWWWRWMMILITSWLLMGQGALDHRAMVTINNTIVYFS